MKRLDQIILIGTFPPLSWLGMQLVHELGHCIGAWLTGGTVARVIAHPLTITHTILSQTPHPLFVVWAGPVIGCILPAIAVIAAHALHLPGLYLFRFFAGFCFVANAVYIGLGSINGLMDAGDMMSYGSPRWTLLLFSVLAGGLGLLFWNGIGPGFGLGRGNGRVSRAAAITSACLLLAVAGIEMIVGA